MRRPLGLRFGMVVIALGALLLGACESSSGGDGDTAGAADVPIADTAGGDGGGGADLGSPDVACVPSCAGRECGDDGCGGTCGSCSGSFACTADGACVCEPQCEGRVCGPDPACGVSCGTCDLGTVCAEGACVPGGDISCVAYFVCLDNCDAGDAECAPNCRTAVAEDVGELVDRVETCFGASCDTCADLDCLRTCGVANCGQDYVDCFSGSATCYDVYTCVDECWRTTTFGTDESEACRANCLASGTVDDQNRFLALEQCVFQEGGCDPSDPTDYPSCEQRARRVNCASQSADCPQD